VSLYPHPAAADAPLALLLVQLSLLPAAADPLAQLHLLLLLLLLVVAEVAVVLVWGCCLRGV
jgi:hypothetical protein